MEQETIDALFTGSWSDSTTETTFAFARTRLARWSAVFVGNRRIEVEVAASVLHSAAIAWRYAGDDRSVGRALMFRLDAELRAYLHRDAIDFRVGINSLVMLVVRSMQFDPFAHERYSRSARIASAIGSRCCCTTAMSNCSDSMGLRGSTSAVELHPKSLSILAAIVAAKNGVKMPDQAMAFSVKEAASMAAAYCLRRLARPS
ncbi:hypothetical protein OKW37_003250 [Paraburkholderia sp. MM5482-R2]